MRLHRRMDVLQHPALDRRVEVDHHVAAEHEVERGTRRRMRIEQVVVAEPHRAGELGPHADGAAVGTGAAQEVPSQAFRRQPARISRVDGAAGGVEHPRVDVARDDAEGAAVRQRFAGGDRDRVRLLAGRGGAAPQTQTLPVVLPQGPGKRGEVVRLAEERRQVGRQAVDELLPFGVSGMTTLEPLQVAAEGREAFFAQPPGKPAVDHRPFPGVKTDSGAPADQLAHAPEVFGVEAEFLHRAVRGPPRWGARCVDGGRCSAHAGSEKKGTKATRDRPADLRLSVPSRCA